MASGGKPKGVYVVTDAELKSSVGGVFTVQPGPAIRVAALDAGARGVTGGNIAAVYVVDAAEAARRGVVGGKSVPVVDMTSSVRSVTGPHMATPVYVMSGSLGDGVAPTPPTPPTPSDDWWLAGGVSADNAIAVYQPVGATNLANSYINLANPGTFDAAPGVAPTWSSCFGWTGDGATQYLATGVIPDDGWSMLVSVSNLASGDALAGSETDTTTRLFLTGSTGSLFIYGQGSLVITGSATPDAVYGVAGQQGYLDGAADGGAIGPWSGTNTHEILILAINDAGSPINHGAENVLAVAIYDTTLTLAQVVAITAEMQALVCTNELIETFFGDATIAVQGNQEKDIDEYWGTIIV